MSKTIYFALCVGLLMLVAGCGGSGDRSVGGTTVNTTTPEGAARSFVRAINERSIEAMRAVLAEDEFRDGDEPEDGEFEDVTAEFVEVRDEDGTHVGYVKLMNPDAEDEDEREQQIEFVLIEVEGQWRVSFKRLMDLRMRQAMQGMNNDE
jgi:predicted  nucleic acid-binding Zn-ribbon protein